MGKKVRVPLLVVVIALLIAFVIKEEARRRFGDLRAAFDPAFLVRPEGYQGFCKHYGFEFSSEPTPVKPGALCKSLKDRNVDVINVLLTDPEISAFDLLPLEDDKAFFSRSEIAPVVRNHALDKHPEIAETLHRLAGKISDEAMREMKFRVSREKQKASDVAREFLSGAGLTPGAHTPEDQTGPSVTIGVRETVEHEILAETVAQIIEAGSGLRVIRKTGFTGSADCFRALQSGELDLCTEDVRTALVEILKGEPIADPQSALEFARTIFDVEHDLAWLEPFGFSNSDTLAMRRKQAERLGISSISDLATHVLQQRNRGRSE